jgi:hypothetical protein
MEVGRDDRRRGVQQGRENGVDIKVALMSGPEDAGQNLLRVRTLAGAFAAPAHLPHDDRRADRLLGSSETNSPCSIGRVPLPSTVRSATWS